MIFLWAAEEKPFAKVMEYMHDFETEKGGAPFGCTAFGVEDASQD